MGRHKALKLLSLLLAAALWFAVGSEEPTESTLNLALDLANVPVNLMVTNDVPPALQVRVLGPGSVVRKLAQTRQTQTLDLSGYKSGRHIFPMGPNSFNFPRGAVVTRVQPNPIIVILAPTITRSLQIQPLLEGKPSEGFEVANVQMRPPQIKVQGPYHEISDLKFLPTLPIDVSHLTASATVASDLDFKNLHLTLKEQGPILADITIKGKENARTIPGVPVVAGPRLARLDPSQVTITLQGPSQAVKDLKLSDLRASVDTKNLTPGRHRLKVSVQLPAGLNLVSVQPDTVAARPKKSP